MPHVVTNDFPEDSWYRLEIDYLQQDLEEATLRADLLESENEDLDDELGVLEGRVVYLQKNARELATVENAKITQKALQLMELVEEYGIVLDQYVALTQTKLVTTKLNNLLKDGGYTID